jgi:NTE family protein
MVGLAHHAGVLHSLHHHLGWDPRCADVVVGSSAGSIVSLLLRRGVSSEDLAALLVDAPVTDGRVSRVLVPMPELPRPGIVELARAVRPPSPLALARTAVRLRSTRPGAALAAAFAGLIRIDEAIAPLGSLGHDWPTEPTWIVAVRADGRRVVFGRDELERGWPRPPVARAVAASCAIPGLARPVRIGRTHYVDGGAHSPTNADVLADPAVATIGGVPRLVIVSSPMSARPGAERGRLDGGLRRRFHRWLEHEVAALQEAGADVVVFEPPTDELRAAGWNPLSADRVGPVVRESFLAAGDLLQRGSVRTLLAPLATRVPTAAAS